MLGICVVTLAPAWAEASLDIPENPVAAPGLIIGALRNQLGMTLVQLSERSGVSAATLSRFERGITASRILARRDGGPEVCFDDRNVVFDHDGVACALGFEGAAHLRSAMAQALENVRAGEKSESDQDF